MIEITDLSFGYSKKRLLFENLNLSLQGGRIYGLLGKNGAGKSTLLKNICGLAFPRKGSCTVNGIDSSRRLPVTLQDIYLVPEEVYVPAVTIKEYVKNTAPFYPRFDNDQFEKYLFEFEVPLLSRLNKLSFGQQKKVIISFGIATNTNLLIMDEPTNGLDIPSKSQFRKTVSSAFDEERCIVMSTHQVRDLDNLIDSLVIVHHNKIILNKTTEQIAEKLRFQILHSDQIHGSLYNEDSIKGSACILPNTGGLSNRVDIELLFNALTSSNKQQQVLEALN